MSKSIHSNYLSSTENSAEIKLTATNPLEVNSVGPTNDLFHQELGAILKKQHQNHCNVHEQPLRNFARYLRAARQNAGLTPATLAKRVGATEAAIYALEHAMMPSCEIDASLLWDIAEALDEDVHLFLLLLERADPAVRQRSWLAPIHSLASHFTSHSETQNSRFWFSRIRQSLKKIWVTVPQGNGYYLRACSGAVGILCMFVVFYFGNPELDSFGYPLSNIDHLSQASPTAEVRALPTLSVSTNRSYEVSWGGNGGTVKNAVVIPIDMRQDAIFLAKRAKSKPLLTCQETTLAQLTQNELCPV